MFIGFNFRTITKRENMTKDLLFIEREYIRMETLLMGNPLAVKKTDYDRILFLTEIYGKADLIPVKEMVYATPLIEKKNEVFELAQTGAYMISMKDLKLTINKEGPPQEN